MAGEAPVLASVTEAPAGDIETPNFCRDRRGAGAPLRGSRYSFGCCSRRRRAFPATTSLKIGAAIRSSDLHLTTQRREYVPVQIPRRAAHRPRSYSYPRRALASASPFRKLESATATKLCRENRSPLPFLEEAQAQPE